MSGCRFKVIVALGTLSLLVLSVMGGGLGNRYIGGPCTYDEYNGQCKICSINKTNESAMQENTIGGPGYAGFEVRFEFIPAQPLPATVSDKVERFIVGCKNLLLLYNGWYPGPKFLQKYNVTEDAEFNCSLNVENSGTCTPVIIEQKDVDGRDYFESSA